MRKGLVELETVKKVAEARMSVGPFSKATGRKHAAFLSLPGLTTILNILRMQR